MDTDDIFHDRRDPIHISAEMVRRRMNVHDPLAHKMPEDWETQNVRTMGVFPMTERYKNLPAWRDDPRTHHAVYRYDLVHKHSGETHDMGADIAIGANEGDPQGGGFGPWSSYEKHTLPKFKEGRYY